MVSANVMKAGMVKLVSIQLLAILHGRKAMKCAKILKMSSVLVQVRCLLLLWYLSALPAFSQGSLSFLTGSFVEYVSRD